MSEHAMQAQRLREIDDLLAECQRHGMPGVMVSYAQLRALRAGIAGPVAEVERLTDDCDRYREFHDKVASTPTYGLVTETAHLHLRRGDWVALWPVAGASPRCNIKLIVRPQPLKEGE